MGLALLGLLKDLGEFLTPSVVDLLGVALLGPLLGLLTAPTEAVTEDFTDVLNVIGDAEMSADHLGDPLGTP